MTHWGIAKVSLGNETLRVFSTSPDALKWLLGEMEKEQPPLSLRLYPSPLEPEQLGVDKMRSRDRDYFVRTVTLLCYEGWEPMEFSVTEESSAPPIGHCLLKKVIDESDK